MQINAQRAKKQQQNYKPGSVLREQSLSLILTGHRWPVPATYPSQRWRKRHTEASNFHFGTYLVFQLLRFTAGMITHTRRELLPHVFTLTLQSKAVYFLWHWLSPAARRLPVRKQDALCCPDFPPPVSTGSDRAFCKDKYSALKYNVRPSCDLQARC